MFVTATEYFRVHRRLAWYFLLATRTAQRALFHRVADAL